MFSILALRTQHLKLDGNVFLVSYDVTALLTNVPLDETIHIPADKAFKDNWFNKTYNMNISKDDLIELLTVATHRQKKQLFQFNGNLYEQVDGVALGSPLGPVKGNAFMCSVEEKQDNKLPSFYKRYVHDTLALVRDLSESSDLLMKPNPSFNLRWKWQPTIDCHSLAWKSS